MNCMLAGYLGAQEGQRGWAGTPPPSDLVSFLNSSLTGEDLDRTMAFRRGMSCLHLGQKAMAPRNPAILSSTLVTPLLEPWVLAARSPS